MNCVPMLLSKKTKPRGGEGGEGPDTLCFVVDRPLTSEGSGTIRFEAGEEDEKEWTDLRWTGPGGAEWRDCRRVTGRVGTYEFSAVHSSSTGVRFTTAITLSSTNEEAACVEEYAVSHASTSSARDGRVEARGEGLASALSSGSIQLLWTNGVRTTGPSLHDVPSGFYCAVAVWADDARPVPFLHLAPPAHVRVFPRENLPRLPRKKT